MVLHCVRNIILTAVTLDPLDIATDGIGEDAELVSSEFMELLELNNLFFLMKEFAVIISAIMILGLLISMHFIKKSDKLAEKKDAILHKFKVLFIIFSLVWIFNIVFTLLDSIF